MRTKRYQRSSRKKRTVKRRKEKKRTMKKYKGGNYYSNTTSITTTTADQLNQIPSSRYIPPIGETAGIFNYPQPSKGLGMITMDGGRKRYIKKSMRKIKSIKQKALRRFKGGNLTSIVPQQIVNSGRNVSGFFMDKLNAYQGYPSQASYLPYVQPIDNLSSSELISLY